MKYNEIEVLTKKSIIYFNLLTETCPNFVKM